MIVCMLRNAATDRYHPIVFRIAPLPGPAGDPQDRLPAQRYKSHGHHTEGFDTLEAAEADDKAMCEQHGFTWQDLKLEWDGEGVPAMVQFFPHYILLRREAAKAA